MTGDEKTNRGDSTVNDIGYYTRELVRLAFIASGIIQATTRDDQQHLREISDALVEVASCLQKARGEA